MSLLGLVWMSGPLLAAQPLQAVATACEAGDDAACVTLAEHHDQAPALWASACEAGVADACLPAARAFAGEAPWVLPETAHRLRYAACQQGEAAACPELLGEMLVLTITTNAVLFNEEVLFSMVQLDGRPHMPDELQEHYRLWDTFTCDEIYCRRLEQKCSAQHAAYADHDACVDSCLDFGASSAPPSGRDKRSAPITCLVDAATSGSFRDPASCDAALVETTTCPRA